MHSPPFCNSSIGIPSDPTSAILVTKTKKVVFYKTKIKTKTNSNQKNENEIKTKITERKTNKN